MSDIYSLLKINEGVLRDFRLLADRVADHQTEKVINKNMSKLKQIEERMLVDKGLEVSQQSIDEVINKVICMAPSGDTSANKWTVRELRIISYNLMRLCDNSNNYTYALDLLNDNWKNLFFNGLSFHLLNSWHSIKPDYRTLTSQLLMRKLGEYHDSNRKYNLWKNRLNLFDNNGPMRMAAMLSAKKMSIEEAPTLLGYKASLIKQPYFSDVIIKYVINNDITDRESIESIFKLHNLDRTKKLIFAYLVEKEDQIGDGLRRAQLCRFANTQLGDVSLSASWAPFTGATEIEEQRLKRSMELVNRWFTQQIIESFFEICVQDKERMVFWLKYVNYISSFKIVGSTAIKRLLQSNSKIGSMFLRHYIETNSHSSQTSALVLFIKNKMIVEFSDTGALYVYNQTHQMVKTVTNARYGIASTNDLKKTSMDGIVEKDCWGNYSIYNEQGKLHHRGNWQFRLTAWMNHTIFSSQNTSETYTFKAKPLSANNVKPERNGYLEKKTEEPSASNLKRQNVANIPLTNKQHIGYTLVSKTLDNNVQVVANNRGFYLYLGNNHYRLIKPFALGVSPTGNIWIKNAPLSGWYEILHNYIGSDVRSIGFIRIKKDEVIYKILLSDAGKIRFKMS